MLLVPAYNLFNRQLVQRSSEELGLNQLAALALATVLCGMNRG